MRSRREWNWIGERRRTGGNATSVKARSGAQAINGSIPPTEGTRTDDDNA